MAGLGKKNGPDVFIAFLTGIYLVLLLVFIALTIKNPDKKIYKGILIILILIGIIVFIVVVIVFGKGIEVVEILFYLIWGIFRLIGYLIMGVFQIFTGN